MFMEDVIASDFHEISSFLTRNRKHGAAPRPFRYERSGVNVHQVPSIFPFPSISVFVLAVASLATLEGRNGKTEEQNPYTDRVTAALQGGASAREHGLG